MSGRSAPADDRTRPGGPGPRVIRPLDLAARATHAAGVSRLPAITHELAGADHLWVGMTVLEPGTRTGPHHHGDHETAVYLVAGRVRLRWGSRLESEAELEAGDLLFLPPHLAHDEANPSAHEPAVWVTVWDGGNTFVPLMPDADGVYGPGGRS